MRKSNFELLRIFGMLAIIMGHMAGQGLNGSFLGWQELPGLFLSSASRFAVSLFLMTGLWFMVDAEFSPKRVLKLYSALWFWSVVLTYFLVIIGQDVSLKDMVSCFIPVMRRWAWFVPVYIVLTLISPFLRKACLKMNKKELLRLVVLGFIFLSIVSTVSPFMDTWYCALIWFIYMYFVIYFYKKYLYESIKGKKRYLFMGLIVYIALVGGRYLCTRLGGIFELPVGVMTQYISDYKSIPNLMCTIPIFIFFSKIDIGSVKWVNALSKNTMDVYLIHQTESFYMFLWKDICRTDSWQNSQMELLIFVLVTLAVFAGCSLMGRMRVLIFEPLWVKSRLFAILEKKMGLFYKDIEINE